jgi:hypothetical protein
VGRSLANDVFNLDRSTGVEAFGTMDLGEVKPEYRVMLSNGFRENESLPFGQQDNSPAVAARLDIPLGGATSKDFDVESDLEMHENPVGLIAGSFAYTNDRDEDHFYANGSGCSNSMSFLGKSWDGRSDVFKLGGEMTQLGADASLKYQGFSTTFEGFYQHVDGDRNEIADASDFDDSVIRSGIDGLELDNYGWYWQAGYFIVPKTFELAARVGGVCVDNTNDAHEYTGGWNWYLAGNDLKLSMDITYIDDLPINNSSDNFYGVQNNGLFMIRSQLQFQF